MDHKDILYMIGELEKDFSINHKEDRKIFDFNNPYEVDCAVRQNRYKAGGRKALHLLREKINAKINGG